MNNIGTEEAKKRADKLREEYIEEEGPENQYIQKLELDRENKDFFKNSIIKDHDREGPLSSHERLEKAEKEIKDYLKRKKEESSDYTEYLKKILEKITQNLVFTEYVIEEDTEAGLVFESLNDRGKGLSQLEKVKNFLLHQTNRIGAEDLTDKINYGWGKYILENLAEADQDNIKEENRFLRNNYILRYYSDLSSYTDKYGKKVSKSSQLSDIHGKIKELFRDLESEEEKCRQEMEEYIESLIEMSRHYKYLFKPYESTNSFQHIQKRSIKEELRIVSSQLNRLKGTSSTLPLLLSVNMEFKDEPEKLLQLMKLIERFAFLIYYVKDKRSYTARSKARGLSNRIYKNELGFRDIKGEILDIITEYISSEEIKKRLTDPEKDYYDWDGLRYFLYEYERKRCSEEDKGRPEYHWEEIKGWKKEETIEHILPQTIGGDKKVEYWTNRFDQTEHEEYVNRLGNLTLTEKNSKLGNRKFEEKQKIYIDSNWQIEKDLGEKWEKWSKENIENREEELARFAEERWEINEVEDFSDKERFFWYNTNRNNVDELHDRIFEEGIVATYGPKKYKEKLDKASEGDRVFAYVTGVGIRAVGTIQRGEIQTEHIEGHTRYSRPVNWEVVSSNDESIEPSQIREMGYEGFRGAFHPIRDSDIGGELLDKMKAKSSD